MTDTKKPDSGGAAFIARQFVDNLRKILDEQHDDIASNRKDITDLRIAFAHLTGKLAVVVAIVSIVVSALVAVLVRVLF